MQHCSPRRSAVEAFSLPLHVSCSNGDFERKNLNKTVFFWKAMRGQHLCHTHDSVIIVARFYLQPVVQALPPLGGGFNGYAGGNGAAGYGGGKTNITNSSGGGAGPAARVWAAPPLRSPVPTYRRNGVKFGAPHATTIKRRLESLWRLSPALQSALGATVRGSCPRSRA